MTARGKKLLMKPLALVLAAITLEGCVSTQADEIGRYATPIGGSPVITNETPYSQALRCMASYTKNKPVKLAVVNIADYTGKTESDGSGRQMTQGASLMAMSALGKAGVRQVERFDTSGFEMDLKYANNKLIGETDSNGDQDYRKIVAGSVAGSDYYIAGGITELNLNIGSNGANGTGGETAAVGVKGTLGVNAYVMNVAIDLRLVDSKTTEVVDTISYQKQIVGRQISAGVFDFLGGEFFDASFGGSALEPKQLAVRSLVERGMLEMIQRLYRLPAGTCDPAQDPLNDTRESARTSQASNAPQSTPENAQQPPYPQQTAPQTPVAQQPQYAQQSAQPQYAQQSYSRPPYAPQLQPYSDQTRQDPYRWYGDSDPASSGLRGPK